MKRSALSVGLGLSLFAFVLGCRWAVIDRFGSDLPNWDQWDAEALVILHPWLQHGLTAGAFLEPHNEHRIVLTKLLALALVMANGQWDQRLETVVNAALPAAIAVGWFALSLRLLSRRWMVPAWLFTAAVCAAPLSWQNVIAGFHSQQFFLIGLSIAAIAGLGAGRPFGAAWWTGAAAGLLALGSMATGFFASLLAVGIAGIRRLRGEIDTRSLIPTAALGTIFGAAGVLLTTRHPGHEVLMARSPSEFFLSILRSLQWPLVDRANPAASPAWAAVVLWLPWVWLAADLGLFRRRERISGTVWVLLALGGWTLLQVAATAYARGAGAEPPAPRYVDSLVVGALTNALALAWFGSRSSGRFRWFAAAAGCLWLAVFAAGARGELERNFTIELPAFRNFYADCRRSVRNYLATGDESWLKPGAIPYPSVPVLIDRLNLTGIRDLLPASVRSPLALTPSAGASGFVDDVDRAGLSPATPELECRRTWGSFGREGTRSWTSLPLEAGPGWLAIETAGQPGQPGVSLELRAASDGRLLETLQPSRLPGDTWRTAYARSPREPFVVRAEVAGPDRWLAFSEPVEMRPLSHWAWEAARQGLLLAEIAAAVGLALCLLAALTPRLR